MSNVNIMRAVENIRSGTTVYTPIIETVINAIQAIEDKGIKDGKIDIVIERSSQEYLVNTLPPVLSFLIKDNGIGFTDENRDSFDTLYSDYKNSQGGKGFGRFICLKYFEDLEINSIYQKGQEFKSRKFRMGKGKDIIVDEKCDSSNENDTRTTVKLARAKGKKFTDKKIRTIARTLAEKLLPYLIDQNYDCPVISITESDRPDRIVLNDFVSNQLSALIKEITLSTNSFSLQGNNTDYQFMVRLFKFYSPKNQKSKISLVAHRREVINTAIDNYIPEFIDEFFDKKSTGSEDRDSNYVVKAYVSGNYLDKHVSLERAGFEFNKEDDLIFGISQTDIEKQAAEISRAAIGDEITARQEKKKERVRSYVDDEAPWHRSIFESVDLSSIAYKPSKEEIELKLQEEKYRQEIKITKKIGRLLQEGNIDDLKDNVSELVRQISENSKNDLIHYIALRRKVLELFSKKLELDPDDRYSSEGAVHDIIFPRHKDTDSISFKDHNLWIIDERLNFTNYVSSDKPLGDGNTDRPDLLAYDRRVLFRGDNEPSNPVTIFEFKRPQRDDFVNPSSTEDPIQQIVRYVNQVREGKFRTPKGRNILVSENTPFYGYVVCDLTPKVKTWLELEKDHKPMPDRLGWFKWHDNINLYLEVISWDKVLRDAKMRNQIFFHKLGIS